MGGYLPKLGVILEASLYLLSPTCKDDTSLDRCRFLFPIEGEFIVIAWSVAELEKIGIKVETGTEFLTKFTKDDSLVWCSKHMPPGRLRIHHMGNVMDVSTLWQYHGMANTMDLDLNTEIWH